MLNVFYKPKEEYQNKLDPLNGYLNQLIKYIQQTRQVTPEKAREVAIKILKATFKDKEIKHFAKDENDDKYVETTTLYKYIQKNIQEKNILAPTFTSYVNTSVERSILSEFTDGNARNRGKVKKEGQAAKAAGNLLLAEEKNNEQNKMKIFNNSLSGTFGLVASIFYNPTAHSTLTSITRTMTSLSNASNEKLIMGNRFYPRGIDVLNNIVFITSSIDVSQIKKAVDEFNLYIPTVQDVVDVLKYSSDLYFSDRQYYATKIIPYLETLTVYELAAIVYAGDLYHIRQYNPDFMMNFMKAITKKVIVPETVEDVVSKLYKIEENILNYVHHILYDEVKGYGKDYPVMLEKGITSSIYATCENVSNVLLSYKTLFNCFFMTDLMPGNSFRLQFMRRRAVVLSDTDSTCFTLDNWVKWFHGGVFKLNSDSLAVGGAIAYIAAQAIVNQLAILSRHMNVEEKELNRLAMKNEYLWEVFMPLDVSKHYFASTIIQEGNVFKKAELEKKGVHVKNSAVPKSVLQVGNDLVNYIFDGVRNNKQLYLDYILTTIIDMENRIIESISSGKSEFLKQSKIKDKNAYSQDETKSPYARHLFWVEVFSPTYGPIGEPPYNVYKLPTILKTKTALREWVASIEDIELQGRLNEWLTRNNKTSLPTMYVNESYVMGAGVPKEILSVVNINKIILDVTLQHRSILEALGVVIYKDVLIKDQFRPKRMTEVPV